MLALHDVSKTYTLAKDRSVAALQDIDMEVADGEFIVVTGRSGSGKSTLLNLMAGLTRPSSGRVVLDDVDLWSLPDREQSRLRNRKFGFVFQFPSLLPALTTLENVLVPTIFADERAKVGAHERAMELLAQVGLADRHASYPRQLSAGQQQRVVIARALLNRPEILLADEPTSDLDEQTEQEIMDLFRDIHRQNGITVVLVTHASQLVGYGTRALRLANGAIA
jgi:ABC-type lipoprotein export system ATPase subunit